jgi:hypothetical protein
VAYFAEKTFDFSDPQQSSNLGVRGSNPFERARFQGFFERAKFLALRK